MSVGVFIMKPENKRTYLFFRQELEELLKAGFSREQAFLVLKRIHSAIDKWKGYHYANVSYSAGQSLEYLIKQVDETEAHEIWQHGVIEKWKNTNRAQMEAL